MSEAKSDGRRKGRLTLLFLAVVFLGPMVAAVVIYFNDFRWRPAGSIEQGMLYKPPRALADATMTLVDATAGGGAASATLRGKWTLIYLGSGDCEAPCREALTEIRQVRLALGRDMDRVQRLYVVTTGTADLAFLARDHAGIGVIPAGAAARALVGEIGERWAGDMFLTDPHANLVMRYPAGTTMKGMHGDLKHLLAASSIG